MHMESSCFYPITLLISAILLISGGLHGVEAQKCVVTPPDSAGPFFQFSGVPNKGSWICRAKHRKQGPPSNKPERVVITGRVFDEDCETPLGGPGKRAFIHVWQADSDGVYDDHLDESSHYCRGRINVNENGKFRIKSIFPGLYPGRPRHFHVRVEAEGYNTIVTQLYITGDPTLSTAVGRERDMNLRVDFGQNGKATYNFYLAKKTALPP